MELLLDRGAAQMYTRAATGYGVYFLHRGAPRAALALFELSRLMDPTLTDAVAYLGIAHQSLGEMDEAERILRESVRIVPHRHFPRASLAFVLLDRGKGEEARELFERLVAEQADDDRALFGMGLTDLRAGRTAEAAEWFTRTLEAAPRSPFGRRAEQILADLNRDAGPRAAPRDGEHHVSG